MLSLETERKLLALLEEIRVWSKFGGFEKLSELLKSTLNTKRERMIYEESDGEKSSRQIASTLDITYGAVVNMWKRWHALGLVEESTEYKGRYKHILSLQQLGIRMIKRKAVRKKKIG